MIKPTPLFATAILLATAGGANATTTSAAHPAAAVVTRSLRSAGTVTVTCDRENKRTALTRCVAIINENGQTAQNVKAVYARYAVTVTWSPGPRVVSRTCVAVGVELKRSLPGFVSYDKLDPGSSVPMNGGTLTGVKAVYQPALQANKIYWVKIPKGELS